VEDDIPSGWRTSSTTSPHTMMNGWTEAEDDALDRARPMQPDADDDEVSLLQSMREWAVAQ